MMNEFFRVKPVSGGRFIAQTKTLKGWVDISVSRGSEGEAMQDIDDHQEEVDYE